MLAGEIYWIWGSISGNVSVVDGILKLFRFVWRSYGYHPSALECFTWHEQTDLQLDSLVSWVRSQSHVFPNKIMQGSGCSCPWQSRIYPFGRYKQRLLSSSFPLSFSDTIITSQNPPRENFLSTYRWLILKWDTSLESSAQALLISTQKLGLIGVTSPVS